MGWRNVIGKGDATSALSALALVNIVLILIGPPGTIFIVAAHVAPLLLLLLFLNIRSSDNEA